ncbi:hypothetical protein [Sporichthya polymorpha]|uniref:hypothetical protein n=1 Tax=Sporichthya polymorpha TaxID=35751 RepID=UPI000368BF39|nr:hypothetical protein [Sporichthya polymorpha]
MTDGSDHGEPEYDEVETEEVETEALPTARSAAVVGMLGVGSLPGMLFCGLGTPMAVLALALAPSARRQVVDSGGRLGGLGVIRAARICSVVSLVIALVMAVGLVLAWNWLIDYAREHNGD